MSNGGAGADIYAHEETDTARTRPTKHGQNQQEGPSVRHMLRLTDGDVILMCVVSVLCRPCPCFVRSPMSVDADTSFTAGSDSAGAWPRCGPPPPPRAADPARGTVLP